MPKPKRKDTHLVFRSHAAAEVYENQPIDKTNRVYIFEKPSGLMKQPNTLTKVLLVQKQTAD